MLPQIKGVSIHMEDKKTVINFPRNRYEDVSVKLNFIGYNCCLPLTLS
jgi:hypothetical protein